MAKINILFGNTNYSIEESALAAAAAQLKSHLSTEMNGSGAVINLGGTSYNIDSAKLSTATNAFVSHLGTIAGSGSKVVVGGVEYSIDSNKLGDAVADLHAVLSGLHSVDDSNNDAPAEDEAYDDVFPIEWNTMDVIGNPSVTIGENTVVKVSNAMPTKEELANLYVRMGTLFRLPFVCYLDDMCIGDDVVTAYYEINITHADGDGYDTYYCPIVVVYTAGNYNGIEISETGLYVPDFATLNNQQDLDFVIDYE